MFLKYTSQIFKVHIFYAEELKPSSERPPTLKTDEN